MREYAKCALALMAVGALLRCGQMPIQDVELIGYEKGVKRMIYHSTIYADKVAEAKGYRLETKIDYSVGAIDRRSYQRTTYMTEDFALVRSQAERVINDIKVVSQTWVEDGQVVLRKDVDGKVSEDRAPFSGVVYGDVHPLLYTKDLTQPGAEKRYPIFSEENMSVRPVAVKYAGAAMIDLNGERVRTVRYQIESSANPGAFDDYFVDPKTKEIVKIDYEQIQFLAGK